MDAGQEYFSDRFYAISMLLLLLSCSVASNSLWPHGLQHTKPSVHHQLPEFTQIHVHWVGDAIQPPHPLSAPSPPASTLSLHDALPIWSSSRFTSIESVMPASHLILCRPLLLLPPIPPSIRVFFNESALHMRWPKYWSFSFSISPSNEYLGLISFRIDWFNLFAVQGTPKNLLQHHSSKASILQHSAFFRVQFSHPYMTTGKTIALIRQTFIDKLISLLFNMLSSFVIAFLPKSKRLLICWILSPFAVILEPRKEKCLSLFALFPHLFAMKWSDQMHGDAIQPSHPLSSPFPPAPNPSQHQGLFQWVNSSHEVAKVLEFQL